MAAGPAAPPRACCCRPPPTWAPTSAWRSVRMPSASSARLREASPGRAGWPNNRCSPTSILPSSPCSTSRHRAVWPRCTRCRARSLGVDQRVVDAGGAGELEQSVRLCRFPFQRCRRARGPSCGGGRDGGSSQRPDRHRSAAPGRSGQPVAHLLSGRRSLRHDQRPASGRCRLSDGGAGPGLSDDLGRHIDRRAGLWRLRADRAAAI